MNLQSLAFFIQQLGQYLAGKSSLIDGKNIIRRYTFCTAGANIILDTSIMKARPVQRFVTCVLKSDYSPPIFLQFHLHTFVHGGRVLSAGR